MAGLLGGSLVRWLVGWLVGLLVGWLVGWLVCLWWGCEVDGFLEVVVRGTDNLFELA